MKINGMSLGVWGYRQTDKDTMATIDDTTIDCRGSRDLTVIIMSAVGIKDKVFNIKNLLDNPAGIVTIKSVNGQTFDGSAVNMTAINGLNYRIQSTGENFILI